MTKSGGPIWLRSKKPLLQLVLLCLFVFTFSLSTPPLDAFAGVITGGGASGAPTSGSGSGGTGYGKAYWAYYILNNRDGAGVVSDSLSDDNWGSSLTVSDCGPYGGFWVLQLSTNGSDNRSLTGAVNVQSAQGYIGDPVERWINGSSGGTNITLISPFNSHLACNKNSENKLDTTKLNNYRDTWESPYTFAFQDGSLYIQPDDWGNYCVCDAYSCYYNIRGIGKTWNQVKDLFKSKNGNSTGGCSAINNGAGDDCWASYSQMKYFCYGDTPVYTHTLKYDLCSGSGTFPDDTKTTDTNTSLNMTISSNSPTRDGHWYKGWSTTSCSGSVSKQPGQSVSVGADASVTIYAIWKKIDPVTFTGSTSGTINHPDPRLSFNSDYTSGTINNQTFNSTTGKYSWADPANGTYTATFTHTLTRTDSNNNEITSAKTQYKVQQKIDNGSWTDVNDWSDIYVGYNGSNTVDSTPQFTLNSTNHGRYIRYCQRLAYKTPSTYNTSGFSSFGNATNTSEACIVLKNPNWEEPTTTVTSYIDVTGATTTPSLANSTISGARSIDTNSYETTHINASFLYDHSLTRADSGFNPADGSLKFYNSTRPTTSVTTLFNGKEKIDSGNIKLIGPVGHTNNTLAVQFSAPGSWASTSARGRTSINFNATPNDSYAILAGQTKTFYHLTHNLPTKWKIDYKHFYRREAYSAPWADKSGQQAYVRTEAIDLSPQTVSNPASFTSSPAVNITLNRPYHYVVTSITPDSKSNNITQTGEEAGTQFTFAINRPTDTYQYITDLRSHQVSVLTYKIPSSSGANLAGLNRAILGGTVGGTEAGLCTNFFAAKNIGIYDCGIAKNGTVTAKDNNTTKNHVYSDTHYTLSYSTGSIKVPEMPTGDSFCVALAIPKYKSHGTDKDDWLISKSSCNIVTKQPTVQVLGGDVRSNGFVRGSLTTFSNKYYGSWSDFIVSASGKITKFGSGAALANGANNSALCKISSLTIANDDCASNQFATELGKVSIPINDTATSLVENMATYYVIDGTSRDASGCDQVNCLIQTDVINSDTFTSRGFRPADNFLSSKPLIFYSTGSIRIDTDIQLEPNLVYSDGITPQVIIIAERDVKVSNSVTRLDAWIIAGGKFVSCAESGTDADPHSDLSLDVCTNQLTIKGAVAANTIDFSRTFGGDPNAARTVTLPAETVYYSPMTLIFSAREATRDTEPQTTYLHKLPPRY